MISPAIQGAKSIDEVAKIINAANRDEVIEYFSGTDLHSAEQLAGQYAYSAADEAGYGMSETDFQVQLDILSDAGAVFVFDEALKEAVRIKKR